MQQILTKSPSKKVIFLGGFNLGQMIDCQVLWYKNSEASSVAHSSKCEGCPRFARLTYILQEQKSINPFNFYAMKRHVAS